MAYTNAWSNTIPPGTSPANTIDTIIQQLRLDVSQRMNTILGSGTDWNSDDPVVNGTTNKDLTALTTLVNTKATLTGLVTGQLLVATGGSSIGNLGKPGTILTDATSVDVAINTGASTIFLEDHLPVGSYLVTLTANNISGGSKIIQIVDGTGNTGANYSYHLVGTPTDFIVTVLFELHNAYGDGTGKLEVLGTNFTTINATLVWRRIA